MATKQSIPLDLAGKRFGRWTALRKVSSKKCGWKWECQCDCGAVGTTSGYSLVHGKSLSCGCLRTEQVVARSQTHGQSPRIGETAEYRCWCGIIKRCENPNEQGFPLYGGRGIRVCQRWRESFAVFFEDMGPKPSTTHQLDRYPDMNGDYEPNNCRWATPIQNARNKRNNRLITAFGQTLTEAEWCEKTGMKAACLCNRFARGMTPEDALTRPLVYVTRKRKKRQETE